MLIFTGKVLDKIPLRDFLMHTGEGLKMDGKTPLY